MKQPFSKFFATAMVLALMVSVFAACSAKSADTGGQSSTGASGTNAPSEKKLKIGMVPKFTGVDYFIAVENGAKKAAADLGVQLDWQGDPSGQESAAKQQAYIQTFIDKGYDAILVSALDEKSYADTLKQARSKGIKVVTWDADVQQDARDYFINQVENSGIGSTLMSNMGKELADKGGKVVIVSSDPNASNQNAWIKAIQDDYNAKKSSDYSKITFFDKIIYAGNNQADADKAVAALLTQNPDITGIFALSTMAVPAAGKALTDLKKPAGSVAIQGLGVPITAKDNMQSGLMKSVVLWQPYDLGYLAVEFASKLKKGEIKKGDTSFKSSLSGKTQLKDVKYADAHKILPDGQVILGMPIVYTIDTLDGFKGYPDADSGLK
ncbi:MAG: permease component of ribose/xylose/arabinose/galactoside ABC-type transporter [Bacilli bacterium]|nr:permease component of ribose/xylose/arabinose/galactoside ABC-type transporter [Bacilli bacterium]